MARSAAAEVQIPRRHHGSARAMGHSDAVSFAAVGRDAGVSSDAPGRRGQESGPSRRARRSGTPWCAARGRTDPAGRGGGGAGVSASVLSSWAKPVTCPSTRSVCYRCSSSTGFTRPRGAKRRNAAVSPAKVPGRAQRRPSVLQITRHPRSIDRVFLPGLPAGSHYLRKEAYKEEPRDRMVPGSPLTGSTD